MLFFLILIFMPVDSFTIGADFLREFGARPVNFILAFLFSVFLLKRIGFYKEENPISGFGNDLLFIRKNDCYLIAFCIYIVFQSIINVSITAKVDNYFLAYSPLFLQSLMFFFAIVSFYCWCYVFNSIDFIYNQKIFFYVAASTVVVLTFFYIDKIVGPCSETVSYYFRFKAECTRASGLSSEPSIFGAWVNFIWPLLFLIKNRSSYQKIISFFLFLLLMFSGFYSGARTFIVILLFQFFVFIFPFRWIAIFICIFSTFSSLFILQTNDLDLSTIARMSAPYSALQISFMNPYFGVGIGQFSFYIADYLPDIAFQSQEVNSWIYGEANSRASTYNLPLRLWLESGIALFIIFYYILFRSFSNITSSTSFLKYLNINYRFFMSHIIGSISFLFSQDQYCYQPAIFSLALSFYFYRASFIERVKTI